VRSGGGAEEDGACRDRLAQSGSFCAGGDFSGTCREAGSGLEIDFGVSPAARGALAGASRRRPEQPVEQDLPLFVAEVRRSPWKNSGGGVGSSGGHEQAGECVAACGVATALRRDNPGLGAFVAQNARVGDGVGASRGLHGVGRESGAGVRSSKKMSGMHDLEGYNSADEYDDDSRGKDAEVLIVKEKKFEKDLWKERGFVVSNPCPAPAPPPPLPPPPPQLLSPPPARPQRIISLQSLTCLYILFDPPLSPSPPPPPRSDGASRTATACLGLSLIRSMEIRRCTTRFGSGA
jgi:hypothetical protein